MQNLAALRAAVFPPWAKNRRGDLGGPPTRAKVKCSKVYFSRSEGPFRHLDGPFTSSEGHFKRSEDPLRRSEGLQALREPFQKFIGPFLQALKGSLMSSKGPFRHQEGRSVAQRVRLHILRARSGDQKVTPDSLKGYLGPPEDLLQEVLTPWSGHKGPMECL